MINKLLERLPVKLLLIAGLFLASFFIFAFIADKVVIGNNVSFDVRTATFFKSYSTPGLIEIMRVLTFLGSSTFLVPAYLVVILYFVFKKSYRKAINILVISSSSFLAMSGLKEVFKRQRPESAIIEGMTSYSFPSGHSLSAFVFCSIMAYLVYSGQLKPVWKTVFIILVTLVAVCVGISRIVLGVHYATDVIAGFSLGVMWVILSFWILRRIRN